MGDVPLKDWKVKSHRPHRKQVRSGHARLLPGHRGSRRRRATHA